VLPRLTGEELRAERLRRGLTLEAFGQALAADTGAGAAYTRQRVSDWERGLRPVPADVERVVLRRWLDQLTVAAGVRVT
jgi:transcriptional regulator with XRE-family HTH domain